MEWTEEDDQKLAIACASTTIADVSGSTGLLADIFGHLDAFNRIRLREVCSGWKEMLSSCQLTTKSVFVDFDVIFTVLDFPGKIRLEGRVGFLQSKGIDFERGLEGLMTPVGDSIFQQMKSSTIYVRVGHPFFNWDTQNLPLNWGEMLGVALDVENSSLLTACEARHVVFFDSILQQRCLKVTSGTPSFGFNRPLWANQHLREISLINCQIIFFSPLKEVKMQRGTVNTLTFVL